MKLGKVITCFNLVYLNLISPKIEFYLYLALLHFKDLVDMECRLAAKRSCSSARRVSNFNSDVRQWGIYPHIKLYCNVLGIDNVMPL